MGHGHTTALNMNKLFGKYSREARLFPALLCSLPFILLAHFAINSNSDDSVVKELYKIFIQDLSLAAVLTYLLSQVNRFVSKALFEKQADFPTVKMLLPSSNQMSGEFRKKLETKVKVDFKLSFPKLEDEQRDIDNAKIRIGEIASLIIHKVRDGRLLLQHNVEYGFARNLIGGSVIALLVSIFCICYFGYINPNHPIYVVSIVFALMYSLPIMFSRLILNQFSKEYAKVLFREYVGIK